MELVSQLPAFLGAVVLIASVPGPAVALLIRRCSAGGFRAGVPVVLGLERHTVYQFQARWTREWRRGRILLAGDAAHLMPPFLGQGMCSGIRDAYDLAWKLGMVLDGVADEGLLDTYGSERLPHVQYFIDRSVELGRVICVTDPEQASARDRELKAAAAAGPGLSDRSPPAPRLRPGVLATGNPAAGRLSVQSRLAIGGRLGLLDDLVGRGWMVLSTADAFPDLPPSVSDLVQKLDMKVLKIDGRDRPGTGAIDVDGRYVEWFGELGVDTVVVRPDFYVYSAMPVEQLTPTLLELRSQLQLTQVSVRPMTGEP